MKVEGEGWKEVGGRRWEVGTGSPRSASTGFRTDGGPGCDRCICPYSGLAVSRRVPSPVSVDDKSE